MEKVKVIGYNICHFGIKNKCFDGFTFLSDLEGYSEPVYIKDQYGHNYGCQTTNIRKIYPPFEVKQLKKGDDYTLSEWEITCSRVEKVTEYVYD